MSTGSFWSKWKKPWTKEQCRRRYVEGTEEIGIRPLADTSGQPKGTVEGWSRRESWVEQRRQYQDTLKVTTHEKTIEKTSEKLSDQLSEIAIANYKVHKLARDYVATIIQIKAQSLAQINKLELDEKIKAIKEHSAGEINQWSQALRRSTDAIAEVTGLKYYVDPNAAIDKLEKDGYIQKSEVSEEHIIIFPDSDR